MKVKTLIVITGPTASGKSALAIKLAEKLRTEIISADSRQIYKGMPIATAMPTQEELRKVPHHLINELPLEAYFSAYEFEKQALEIIENLFKTKDFVIVCGGSMMYIDALCNGIDNLPTISEEIRNQVKKDYDTKGIEFIKNELKNCDPEYFEIVDKKNIKRIIHAVEICRMSGKPYSSMRTGQKKERNFKILKIGLTAPREVLFERINRRTNKMIESGLEQEARNLYRLRHLNSLNTVGLKEMFAYFDGELDYNTACMRISKNTRVYAKKQMTWFKRDENIIWIDISKRSPEEKIMYIIRKLYD